jgi:hypothetical protein
VAVKIRVSKKRTVAPASHALSRLAKPIRAPKGNPVAPIKIRIGQTVALRIKMSLPVPPNPVYLAKRSPCVVKSPPWNVR